MWRIDVENEVNASQRMVLRDNPPVAVTPVLTLQTDTCFTAKAFCVLIPAREDEAYSYSRRSVPSLPSRAEAGFSGVDVFWERAEHVPFWWRQTASVASHGGTL